LKFDYFVILFPLFWYTYIRKSAFLERNGAAGKTGWQPEIQIIPVNG